MAYRAQFDTLRTLAHGGISGTYAPVGSPFTIAPRIICITNLTNGDMIFSDDSSNSDGKLIVGAGGVLIIFFFIKIYTQIKKNSHKGYFVFLKFFINLREKIIWGVWFFKIF